MSEDIQKSVRKKQKQTQKVFMGDGDECSRHFPRTTTPVERVMEDWNLL
jgi:hypothetical protein